MSEISEAVPAVEFTPVRGWTFTSDPIARVFYVCLALALFTAVIVPGFMALRYEVYWKPLDWFTMPEPGGDFAATYAATRKVVAGEDPYSVNSGDPYGRRYSYPLMHILLMLPLAFPDFKVSYAIWSVASVLLVVLTLALTAGCFSRPRLAFLFLLLLYAQSSFMLFMLERGQTDALAILPIALAFYLYLKRGSKVLCGCCLALAASIKVFPAAFAIFFLLRREFKVLAAAAVCGTAIVLCTGIGTWLYYVREIVPAYSNFYLGNGVDHSLYYLAQAFVPDLERARALSHDIVLGLGAVYVLLVLLHRNRAEYTLVELAILSLVIEFSTPWAANYKLVILSYFFLAPLAIAATPLGRKRPVWAAAPLLVCMLLVVPIFGEYVARIPFTLYANLTSSTFVAENPLGTFLGERKVAAGLIVALLYLFGFYAYSVFVSRRPAPAVPLRIGSRRLRVAGALAVVFPIIGSLYLFNRYQVREYREFRRVSEHFGQPAVISDRLTLLGATLLNEKNAHTAVTLYFDSRGGPDWNYHMYLHAEGAKPDGSTGITGGTNFLPSIIASDWPDRKILAVETAFAAPASIERLHIGFFSLKDGHRYGQEALVVPFVKTSE